MDKRWIITVEAIMLITAGRDGQYNGGGYCTYYSWKRWTVTVEAIMLITAGRDGQ